VNADVERRFVTEATSCWPRWKREGLGFAIQEGLTVHADVTADASVERVRVSSMPRRAEATLHRFDSTRSCP
jgi:hypothetical protein